MFECLEFNGNFFNRNSSGKLKIKKNIPLDFLPFFKDVFWYVDRELESKDYNARWTSTSDEDIVSFDLKDFLQAIMSRYQPQDVVNFFSPHLTKTDDNQTMMSQINNFNEVYGSVRFYYDGGWFVIAPENNTTIEEIESIVKPTKTTNRIARNHYYEMNEGKNITTKPYANPRLEQVTNELFTNEDKPIMKLYQSLLPQLDYFQIIAKYNLPTDKLEIVLKD